MSEFEGLSDEFILRMHEFIRQEVQADRLAGTRFIGLPARLRAEALAGEIKRRGLFCTAIDGLSILSLERTNTHRPLDTGRRSKTHRAHGATRPG
ncbi:hypothetical protein IVB45_18435 [Bradyrhizobium sp. 4]|uniref:hypothetical protein n=1 Tax=unclassified Bradyrhizobium TaxID=2631580 RepID=UPI001FF94D20|nr:MULTISPECIES: hypothetical protein [unclassified Bradyrhizobium]MCK1400100.1 hypothetical protein [Bradyrhizobium sp. 39]MCK1750390.1 hypothetical protein [Bradyrhizobium sp. 135]UPJ31999.1 hypothetical protein IVB45_18435 [Bradyrhizobium sp. 4]